MLAVTTGRSGVPERRAAPVSAAERRRPMSDGLMGDASMRITTSLGSGSQMGTSSSESSSVPSCVTKERNCCPVSGVPVVMSVR